MEEAVNISDSLEEAIISYYSDSRSVDQVEELLEWINQDPENLHHFQRIGDIWFSTRPVTNQDFNTSKALKSFRKKIESRKLKIRKKN